MDSTTLILGLVIVVGIVIAIGLVVAKVNGNFKAKVSKTNFEIEGSNPKTGIDLDKVTSKRSSVKAEDKTGQGIRARNIKAQQKIEFTNSGKDNPDPKA